MDPITETQVDVGAFDGGMSSQNKKEHLPHGVVPITWKDGSTTYQFKGQEYQSLDQVPAKTWGWLDKTGEKFGETVAKIPGIEKVVPALEQFGELTTLPGEEFVADQVGQSAQQYGVPYNVGKTLGYALYPGFGEAKGFKNIPPPRGLTPAYVTAGGGPNMKINQINDFNPAQPLMFKKQPRTPETQQLINVNREFKPKGFNTNKWDNYIAKFGSKEGAEAAIKKAEESAAYLKKYGSLKGNKNIWTDPKTGESFLVKNKAKRGEINIGFDSVKMIERTLAKRLEGAKLNTKEIGKIGKELGWDQKKITKYIETSEQAKRTLESLIKDLNKGEGRTMWSLGHRRAVKTQAHSADRITNIELEPLVDVLTEAGRTIKGNTGRAANDELIDILSKITNNPADLKADMIHWGDDIVGKFMPRMREITDAKSFFEEIVKREDFLNKITQYAKKEGVDLEEAADVVMRPLMDKTKVFEETFFDIRSNGF